MPGWNAGAWIYSGRPDPRWSVSDSKAQELLTIWDRLEPSPTTSSSSPRLGYRGCYIEKGDRRYIAYGGIAELQHLGAAETRRDIGRQLERAILQSAPAGLLPNLLPE